MSAAHFAATVESRRDLGGGYFILSLHTDAPAPIEDTVPGQFVMVRGDWGRDLLNPRAFSVLEVDGAQRLAILAKIFGRGTARLAAAEPGEPMTVTGPLGRGFAAPRAGCTQLLVAGGVGLPPLLFQARRAAENGRPKAVEMLYGGRGRDDLVLVDQLDAWGTPYALATDDGSVGREGRVTLLLEERIATAKAAGEAIEILACGPTPMLAAVRTIGLAAGVATYLCLEENMACGFGVCLGCAVPVHGPRPYRYCCTDGPVFDAEEVRWP
ncbi:MAG: dihydroorotate dehydrogenase electron transfer subunit [Myxococcales bacterium]|nr:dihydroorotate dehydrogenase electron transfer subunit [Myxococcales bacterium]